MRRSDAARSDRREPMRDIKRHMDSRLCWTGSPNAAGAWMRRSGRGNDKKEHSRPALAGREFSGSKLGGFLRGAVGFLRRVTRFLRHVALLLRREICLRLFADDVE